MSLLNHTPGFTPDEAQHIAGERFGIVADSVTSLASERDQNFLLTTADGDHRVLKISNALEDDRLIDGQNEMMIHLATGGSCCPVALPSVDGQLSLSIANEEGSNHCVRVLTFVEGQTLASVPSRSAQLLSSLGRHAAEVTLALADFDHFAFHRSFHWDLATGSDVIRARLEFVSDSSLRQQITHCLNEFEVNTRDLLHLLPKSVIHNDMNDGNVVVSQTPDSSPSQVRGIIDFGDAVYSWTVGELAVAAAYGILEQNDPLSAACEIVQGYSEQARLSDSELAALFGLIRLRLCMSVAIAAAQQQARPENPYLSVSQRAIHDTLPLLCSIPYLEATEQLGAATGGGPMTRWRTS